MMTMRPIPASLVLVALTVLLAMSGRPVSAQYTTATIAACPNDGIAGVCVVYSGPDVKTTEAGEHRYAPRSSAELATTTAARKVALNGFDATQKAFVIGTVVPDPSPSGGPSADDVAVENFGLVVQTWRAAKGKQAIAVAFGPQSDIDAAAAAIISEYNKATPTQKLRYDVILAAIQRVFP